MKLKTESVQFRKLCEAFESFNQFVSGKNRSMEKIVKTNDKNQTEASNRIMFKSAAIAPVTSDLNIGAESFHPVLPVDSKQDQCLKLKIPLDSDIWKCISARSPNACHEFKSIIKPQSKIPSIPHSTIHRLFSLNISSDGLIHIFRPDNIHIQISLDQAIHVTCPDQNIHVSVSSSVRSAAIWHPIGRIWQRDSHIDVVTTGVKNKTLRMAKVWFKGISFTTENIPIVYLMDEAGLRTSNDRFVDIKKSQISQTFSNGIFRGPLLFDEAVDVMHKSVHSKHVDGTETIEINQMRVISDPDGVLHIQRPKKRCTIRINPRKAGISLTTSHMHCSASLGNAPHLFLRQQDRRIHFDGSIFCVRNVGHSAGLDDHNKVSIFSKNLTK